MEIIPLRKRLTVNINGEIFKTQKSLIEKVKPLLDEAEIIKPDNQRFILEFVKSYDKVLYKNKSLQRVYFGPNKDVPTYFKNSANSTWSNDAAKQPDWDGADGSGANCS